MNRKLVKLAAVPAALVLSVSLASCGAGNEDSSDSSESKSSSSESKDDSNEEATDGLSGDLVGAGASTQKTAAGAWKNGFLEQNPDASVAYDPVGSGAGRKQFLAEAVSFAGSDAYFEGEQLDAAKERCGGDIIEAPIYIAPIALAYNIEGVDELQLSPSTLAKIFDGKITKWDDAAIKSENEGVELPSVDITTVHRSDDSGTTENFLDYLASAAPQDWTYEVGDAWPASSGASAQKTSGIVTTVSQTNGAIGYADAGQIGDLKAAKILVGDEFVAYSPEAAAKIVDASERVEGRGDHDHAIELKRDTEEAGVYPVVLVSYVIACTKYEDKETADLVAAWLKYVSSEEGQKLAETESGAAPISATTRENIVKAAEAISS